MKKLLTIMILILLTSGAFAQGLNIDIEDIQAYMDNKVEVTERYPHEGYISKWIAAAESPELILGDGKGNELLRVATNSRVISVSDEFMREPEIQKAICKIYGHRWTRTTPNTVYCTNPVQYPDETRECSICGKKQVQEVIPEQSKWKDIK